ncbi:wurmchen 1 transmembrane protein isoform X1 [Oratosquilla oratoria]|uniref:wurmchen 1 transmembrane protein isoform X1 n=1 Tax=Oratosquilla oratoria TaxID=337810 RepID=UPI003F76C14E
MSAHVFWPALTVLAMLVIIVAFLVLKYADRVCGARGIPRPQSFEKDYQSSTNSNVAFDPRESGGDFTEIFEIQDYEERPEKERFEYSDDMVEEKLEYGERHVIDEKYEYAV